MASLCGRLTNQMNETSTDSEFELGEAQKFSYRSLQAATNHFSNHSLIEVDGFAKIYKGVLPNGTLLAVKKYNPESKKHLLCPRIVKVLSCIRHPNIGRVIGYCVHKNHFLLVSEYLNNGSLSDLLHVIEKRESLFNWPMRVAVCYGIARALYHLHEEINPRVIHRDIKPSKVLFDNNFTPKIIGFDIVKFVNESPLEEEEEEDDLAGTMGYLDPEYFQTGKCTRKSDVYGFGVVMLQIISGRKALQNNNNGEGFVLLRALDLLANDRVLEFVDPVLADFPINQVMGFMDVAFSCIKGESRLRPSMGEVIQMLNGVCNFRPTTFETQQPNTPYLSAASSFRSSAEGVIEGESSTVEGESSTQTELQVAAETSVAHSSAINITQQQGTEITVSGSGDLVERLSETMVFERSNVRQGEFAAYARKKNMMPRNKA